MEIWINQEDTNGIDGSMNKWTDRLNDQQERLIYILANTSLYLIKTLMYFRFALIGMKISPG